MTAIHATADDADIDLKKLFGAIWARRAIIFLAVVAAGLVAYGITAMMEPLYKGEATILIESRNGLTGSASGVQAGDQAIIDERGVMSQVQILQSTDLIRTVAKRLDLADRKEFGGSEPSLAHRLLAAVGLASDKPLPRDQRVVNSFRDKLNVYAVTGSRVIVVQFSSVDPQLAADVPNAMANEYLLRQSGLKLEEDTDAAAWLRPEIAKLRDKVAAAESKVAAYRAKTGLLTVGNNDTLASRQLADTASELSRVRSERIDAEARASSVRDALKNGRSIDTLANVVASPLIQQLRQQEVAAQAELADLSTTLGRRHPRIRSLQSQISELDRRITAESRKVLASLENEANIAKLREQELAEQMDEIKANSGQAAEQQVKLQALEREAAADRDLLKTYMARYGEVNSRSSHNALPADARIISNAVPPARPYFPKTVPIIVVAMLAAFLLSSVVVMLIELLSGRALRPVAVPVVADDHGYGGRHFLTPVAGGVASITAIQLASEKAADSEKEDDVAPSSDAAQAEAAKGNAAAVVAATEEAELAARDEVAPSAEEQDFSIAAAAAHLIDKGRALVICVSPEGDEGSAASVVLARLLAEQDFRTVLVDMTESACPTELMAKHDRLMGMTDLLMGRINFAESIHGDRLSAAHIVPRGVSDPAAAMRAADRLPMILDGLRDTYAMVLVECGPSEADDVRRLVRDGAEHDLIVTAIEPGEDEIADTLADFYRAGYDDLIVMMPGLAAADHDDGTYAA